LQQLPGEELWLFKPIVKGEKDIFAAGLPHAVEQALLEKWRDRCLIPHGAGETISFTPSWYWKNSTAWKSLSKDEQTKLEEAATAVLAKSEKVWEKQGLKLLSVLSNSVDMLPCAEDLGAVPACVPKVLKKLGISGLRVTRWYRQWDKEGEPYIPLSSYGTQSVATPAVHDSSTLREWWEQEADQALFSHFIKKTPASRWNPDAANLVLGALAKAASSIFMVQLQDLLHLDDKYYSNDPAEERINIPGTVSDFNWTWRMPKPLEDLDADKTLKAAIRTVSALRKGTSGK
jgi:4-alpha-glucanotransferase